MARTPVTFSLKDFFKSFIARTGRKDVDNRIHRKVLDETGVVIREIVLKDGQIKLFSRIGDIVIRKVKPKGLHKASLNYAESNRYGKKIYHFNDHSDGFIVRILWQRKEAVLNDKYMWLFRPVRAMRRELSAIMKSGTNNYLILNK